MLISLPPELTVIFEGNNFLRLLGGLWTSVSIALFALIIAIPLGIILGCLQSMKLPLISAILKFYLEFVRIMPQLVLLFLVFFTSAKTFGIDISGYASAVVVFGFWGVAEIMDLVRGAIDSVPRTQIEAATSLGMRHLQVQYLVTLPFTVRQLIPQLINLITRMVKTTSLVVLIGVVEVLKVGQQIIDANRFTTAPELAFWVYLVIFLLYFLACWPLTIFASWLEKKLK
ncbi:MAG: amino acid ABC transporter permease [Candidatus Ancillula sp.]|jgi:polar amino acid transport system permease protein|nr:amino acid ABC transporter permease [Candidatus Ancillula sp.]